MKIQSKNPTFKLKYPALKQTIALTLLSSYSLISYAQEGMWVPQQLPEISNALQQAGLKLPPEQLTQLTGDPLGAVLSLGNCTASFVSPGLRAFLRRDAMSPRSRSSSTSEGDMVTLCTICYLIAVNSYTNCAACLLRPYTAGPYLENVEPRASRTPALPISAPATPT